METFWFVVVALMLVGYVILDGFDLGAGAVQWLVARGERERSQVIGAIGPMWDGNEVWLLAAGGTLYFAFPLLYASSFSGFYLPLMMVLWLLILRGMGIEFRHRLEDGLWRSFFDVIFAGASALLAVFFGAALGNVIRGVPLNEQGYFFNPLWTDWRTGVQTGILDWYTVLAGVTALVALAFHGANYVAVKTTEQVHTRARMIAAALWVPVVALTLTMLFATVYVRPPVLRNFQEHPWGLLIPLVVFAALMAAPVLRARGDDQGVFVASSIYLAAMLGGAAFALYPNVLPATTGSAFNLTIYNTAAAEHGLRVGVVWWSVGIVIALAWFIYGYRVFRGKVGGDYAH